MSKIEFVFNPYPVQYRAKYQCSKDIWSQEYKILPNKGSDESSLPKEDLHNLLMTRNRGEDLPLVNYTTQYALSCFEGLKAYPNIDGHIALFRPEANAQRFYNSMKGLYMPGFPVDMFLDASVQVIKKSADLGFGLTFDNTWKDTSFSTARSIYLRPFTYSEPGFGVTTSKVPWVIIMATEVGNYLEIVDCPILGVSKRVRATEHGTGWIKCASNYVISALAKKEMLNAGFHEALFLDAVEKKYIEECSSCNVFFVMNDDTIVTPPLGDTILPGITRESTIILAKKMGHRVEERKISIDEACSHAKECFATGTAVGISHFGKIFYSNKNIVFGNGKIGEITKILQMKLKNIQHGLSEDSFNWMKKII